MSLTSSDAGKDREERPAGLTSPDSRERPATFRWQKARTRRASYPER
nr:MAG TPA: hypothetical protein [Caudoviricetes sp.]